MPLKKKVSKRKKKSCRFKEPNRNETEEWPISPNFFFSFDSITIYQNQSQKKKPWIKQFQNSACNNQLTQKKERVHHFTILFSDKKHGVFHSEKHFSQRYIKISPSKLLAIYWRWRHGTRWFMRRTFGMRPVLVLHSIKNIVII